MAQKLRSLPPQVDELKRRGISSVIPLFEGKRPGYGDWQRITEDEAKARFWAWNGEDKLNFGIRLGPSFGNLVDIDLDSAESRILWRYFFPESACFGRGGHVTHVLYKQVGRELMESKRFIWDKRDEKSVLLEVRFNGQTMGPGSEHPESGERIEWMSEVGISELDCGDLRRRSGMLAAASLLLRDWQAGWRDEVCVCLAGAMLRAGWDTRSVDHFFESIAGCAGDEELDGRLKAERLERLLSNGGRVPGLRKLNELVGDGIAGRLTEWLELRGMGLLEEMNDRHALIMVGGSAYILDETTGALLKREAFNILWANRRVTLRGREVSAADFWLQNEDRRSYSGGLAFLPEWRGVEPGSEEFRRRGYDKIWNLWRGWGVTARQGCGRMVNIGGVDIEEEWSSWARHCYEELCWEDDGIWKWVLGWFCHRVARPWEVPGSAIVMVGERGDGKGTIASIFGKLFGEGFMAVTHQNQLVGKFNSHMENKVLIFADEATWGGDKVGEGMLKTMITDERRVIERKGQEAYTIDNCVGYIIASNHDWVVPVGRMERRFFISRMRGRRAGDIEYFDGIREQMLEGGGAEVMLYGMRRLWRECERAERAEAGEGFIPGAAAAGMGLGKVRWTVDGGGGELGFEQWLRGAGSVEQWVAMWLLEWKSGRWLVERGGGRFVVIPWAYQHYLNWAHGRGVRHIENDVIFSKQVRKMLPLKGSGERVRLGIEGRPWGIPLRDGVDLVEYFKSVTGT